MKKCPACKSKTGLRKFSYGMPMPPLFPNGPLIDESKYVLGGCCVSDNDPTIKCIECGWKGEYVNNMPFQIWK